jgi:hypothetical protein
MSTTSTELKNLKRKIREVIEISDDENSSKIPPKHVRKAAKTEKNNVKEPKSIKDVQAKLQAAKEEHLTAVGSEGLAGESFQEVLSLAIELLNRLHDAEGALSSLIIENLALKAKLPSAQFTVKIPKLSKAVLKAADAPAENTADLVAGYKNTMKSTDTADPATGYKNIEEDVEAVNGVKIPKNVDKATSAGTVEEIVRVTKTVRTTK